MKLRWIFALCAILIVAEHNDVKAQSHPSIKVKASVYEDSIILRWAPSSALAWQLLNKYGYRIERYTIVRDSSVLADKPIKNLTEIPLKPHNPTEWEKYVDTDDYVAIAAQAIFGETFDLSNNASQDIAQIVQKSKELDLRFSFTSLAADLSPNAAHLSALRFVDRDVKHNEKYLYRVYSMVPEKILNVDFGFVYKGGDERNVLPVPAAPQVQLGNEVALVKWSNANLKDVYTGYYVERSIDGGQSFKRLTKSPVVATSMESDVNDDFEFTKIDSTLTGILYYYRIIGITSFGEHGPPSGNATWLNEKPLKPVPAIISTVVIDNASVKISWSFSNAAENEIEGFEIQRKNKVEADFDVINKVPVFASVREFIDDNPKSTNYYRLAAFTKGGQRTYSFPQLVQLVDSIPPAAPLGLKAITDSTGIIKLQWEKNLESDLLGYRVYRSNFKNSEFSQITISPIIFNNFIDTINIKSLSTHMWYKVVAIDNRFNTSLFSDVIQVERPDIIPPVAPVIKGVKAKDGGVEIKWIKSSSSDVVEHQIYRKHQYSSSWNILKRIPVSDTTSVFFDAINGKHTYQYSILAVDKTFLKSLMCKPVWGTPLVNSKKAIIEKFTGVPDRANKRVVLSWSYKEPKVTKFSIYRIANGESLMLYKTVNGSTTSFTDSNIAINSSYGYRVKAIFIDGNESEFSNEVIINY
ncbi:fibronectin type III domain-containing protein [Chryseosolibacter indicus]|uniref:Fibronectin type III domain-containing protein n=1 Tax=Chryseosolibacter indicus TaxID=2782351 RepID=A0ABS5VMS0_9BACT|nr:hypothetical protein [Chryseosolibacter indicus]MBT1702745.1 hypothetical protein [Chryseosolibacter indicus]